MLGAWYEIPMGWPPNFPVTALLCSLLWCCNAFLLGLLLSQFLSHCSQEAGQLFLRGSDLCLQKGRF